MRGAIFFWRSVGETVTEKPWLGCCVTGVDGLAHLVPPGSEDEIRERLQPVGKVCREGHDCAQMVVPAGAGDDLTGERIYAQFCFACHDNGVADASRIRDVAAWGKRAAKGLDALVESSLTGIKLMPAMGTCMTCTEQQMHAATEYILERGS
ncbi:MAG: c-type cytochrome [Pseudomonadales bacterium]|nr:c-type cytochrome [Pseudomonadales bacterium]MDP6469893.1 c-type cytochrome [Pseudomonadales bacterium]MDP6827504.1 c-type cytochrome [Pseudomonadales bacterium]